MSVFRTYKSDQFRQLFKAENNHKYDVDRIRDALNIYSLRQTLRKLDIDQIESFLEYQIKGHTLKYLFYECFFDPEIVNIGTDKTNFIINWISQKESITSAYFAQFHSFFNLEYRERGVWKDRFESFIEVLPNEEKIKILNYGKEYIAQSLSCHEISCKNAACDYQVKATSRINKVNYELGKIEPTEQIKLTKMIWKGSGKNLAELFKELKEKGWIEDFEYSTITEAFTKSKSVDQYLKPAIDSETYQPTYENLYSKRYKKMFENIKTNPKISLKMNK